MSSAVRDVGPPLAWLTRPLVWLLTRSSNLLLRPFADRTTFTESRRARLACKSGTVMEILDASPRAVRRVRVIPPAPCASPLEP